MKRSSKWTVSALLAVVLCVGLMPVTGLAQAKPVPATVSTIAQTPEERASVQGQLMELLKVSPQLARVVSSDPSLLANQDYVSHSNPELAQFLIQHPEIARNPSFYLFSDLRQPGKKYYDILQPKEGFEREYLDTRPASERIMSEITPLIGLAICSMVGMWLIKLLVESRRWKRVFTEQSTIHGKLIDKMSSTQELMSYMETDAGKRFLEATPINTESGNHRMPNVVSRILGTTQVGVVLTLLGIGLLGLRNSVEEGHIAMLVLGTVALMPGVGLMLSAGLTWVLAKKLSLIGDVPVSSATHSMDLPERQ